MFNYCVQNLKICFGNVSACSVNRLNLFISSSCWMKGVYDLQLFPIKPLVSLSHRCKGSRDLTYVPLNSHCHLSVIYFLFSLQQLWAFLSDSFKRWLSELSTGSKYSTTSAPKYVSEYIKFKHTRHSLSSSDFSSFPVLYRTLVVSQPSYHPLKWSSVLLLLSRSGGGALRLLSRPAKRGLLINSERFPSLTAQLISHSCSIYARSWPLQRQTGGAAANLRSSQLRLHWVPSDGWRLLWGTWPATSRDWSLLTALLLVLGTRNASIQMLLATDFLIRRLARNFLLVWQTGSSHFSMDGLSR